MLFAHFLVRCLLIGLLCVTVTQKEPCSGYFFYENTERSPDHKGPKSVLHPKTFCFFWNTFCEGVCCLRKRKDRQIGGLFFVGINT